MQGLCPLPRLRQTAICNDSRYPNAFFAWATPNPIFLSGQLPLFEQQKKRDPFNKLSNKLKSSRLLLFQTTTR